ncbi:MAG: hypothetical protein HLUCCX21_03405 [Porphyrobacter sp. HL-46]|nr:MAG: hypothetical protein HLUCCX21_03405 [Porphyrobacter sp. HL-46]
MAKAGKMQTKVAVPRHWRARFLDHLAETSNERSSAAHAGVSLERACRARRDEPEFARQWLAAVAEGYVHLEMEILRRFREGDFKTADAERYDFANAVRLLVAHRGTTAGAQVMTQDVSSAEVRASIDRKIEEIRRRVTRTPPGGQQLP